MKTQKMESEIIFPKNTNEYLKIRVRRVNTGIEISLKSKELETFFSSNGIDESEGSWNGHKSYKLPNISSSEIRSLLNHWGSDNLLIDSSLEYPNMSILRTIGIGKGIKMVIPIVTSSQEVQQFSKAIMEKTKLMYKDYVKPIDITVQMVTLIKEENEDEQDE